MKNGYTVLVTARSFGSADDMAQRYLVEHGCTVQVLKGTDETPLNELLASRIASADGIIAGLEPYDRTLLAKASKLRVISRYGVGYDAVDVAAASKQNIKVAITPGANGDSVADLAVTLMLSAARHVPAMDRAVRAGTFSRPMGVEMWEKTLGVVGTGRIGQGVVKRCKGFSMNVLCYDMYRNEDLQKTYGAKYVDFDELAAKSDFITIHTPLNEETRNMFSDRQFEMMKERAVIVNTARGGIIDENALYRALRDGKIGAAGLDVTVQGNPYDGPLKTLDTCILTPHAGAATYEASSRMSMMAAENLVAVLSGEKCRYAVN